MQSGSPLPPVLFMYLGRLGALGRFTFELAEAARATDDANARFLVSAHNENAAALAAQFPNLMTMATFERPSPGALTLGYVRARGELASILQAVRPAAVVNLMPHVWSPLLAKTVIANGCRFVPVIHDAVPHPGDRTAKLTRWLLRDVRRAHRIVTLSTSVAQSLVSQGYADAGKIETLFHPDLLFASTQAPRTYRTGDPLRLLFFGRIMAYKGLDVLAQAVALAKERGIAAELSVYGSGHIAPETASLLQRIGAHVENRWIADEEITPILARHHAVVCSHVEASQSGVAATAFGHAMPVVALPTGGIVEQIKDGTTGILADAATALSLAEAIDRLASTPGLYGTISQNLVQTAPKRSMAHFLDRITKAALAGS